MDGVTLLMIKAITATNTILCEGDINQDSVVFSITSHDRLLGGQLFVTLRDVVEGSLYSFMQQTSCLTISYH